MSNIANYLVHSEIISGTFDRVIYLILFDSKSLSVYTLHVPTHVWEKHVTNPGFR